MSIKAPVKVVESNSMAESKAMLGLPSAVAPPSLREGAYETVGVHARCSDTSKKCLSKSNAEDKKERTSSCAGIGVASV